MVEKKYLNFCRYLTFNFQRPLAAKPYNHLYNSILGNPLNCRYHFGDFCPTFENKGVIKG